MTPSIHILEGHCLDRLREMPDRSVQCCVTSPPYFGLRDYGIVGQLGLEASPAEYVASLVAVFQEIRRVLRSDGTLWLNLGDSYANDGKWGGHTGGKHARVLHGSPIGRNKRYTGLKPKDLIGIPWRVAFALQSDGWYLRCDIIWHKPNPMPESVMDRPTKAHEYLFLLSKSAKYFYDAEAIMDPVAESQVGREREDVIGGTSHVERGQHSKGGTYRGSSFNHGKTAVNGNGRNQPDEERNDTEGLRGVRNRRSVWTIPTSPYAGAHFATFPPNLIKPCILAGCPVGGLVLDPFAGSGTTGMVALELGRSAILIELNPVYVRLARSRCHVTPGLALVTA